MEISVMKFTVLGPTATILSAGMMTCNFPVAPFLLFFAILKPVVFPLPILLAFVHPFVFSQRKK